MMKNSNGVRIEPGMTVEVVTQSMNNPLLTNGGQAVADAFMRIYGIQESRCLKYGLFECRKIKLK